MSAQLRPRLAPNLHYENERRTTEELLQQGTVYLVCLNRPMGGKRHYIGWTSHLKHRMWHHRHNSGSLFLREANRAGLSYRVTRRWEQQTRLFERFLKNKKNAALLCPRCRQRARRLSTKRARARRRALRLARTCAAILVAKVLFWDLTLKTDAARSIRGTRRPS